MTSRWRSVTVAVLLLIAAGLVASLLFRSDDSSAGGQADRSSADTARRQEGPDPAAGATDDPPPEDKAVPSRGQRLPPAGFPGPDNTGVPPGTGLDRRGALTVTKRGAVLDGLDIRGCVQVLADDVTISRSRIRCNADHSAVQLGDGFTGLTISDSEIDGAGRARATYGADGVTLLRNDIHHVYDGPRIGSNYLIEGNWIHDLVRSGESHNDALQTTGAAHVVVRGNSLQAYSFTTKDPHNSVLMLGTEVGPALDDWVVEGNYADGGSVVFNLRADAEVTGPIVFRDNLLGPNSRHQQSRTGFNRPHVTWSQDNTWLATGAYAAR
ncbi:MAG: Carbohydrate-binding CenC domain protein [Frankiales bacterium]|nr:Carbohydrate-binding CenC domain protein [Frankiales bacterium]